MKRPSRALLVAAIGLLLLGAGLLAWWFSLRPPAPRTPSPDVWERIGVQGDLRTSPDGPPVTGWVCVGSSAGLPPRPGRMQFVVIVAEGREIPSTLDRLESRLTGQQWRPEDMRYLYRAGDPVTTPSGRWQRFSTRWWKGANPPPQAAK